MRFSQYLIPVQLILVLVVAACSRQVPLPRNQRLAVQLFDNQSADASNHWISTLLAYSMVYGLGNQSQLAPGIVNDAEGWRTLGSGRLLNGTIRREGKAIRIEARLTDTATSAILRRFEDVVSEEKLLSCSGRMLESLLGVKAAIPVYDNATWKEFAQAQSSPNIDGLSAFLVRHPSFAPAYPILAELYLRFGKRAEAVALADRLPAGADALSRAQLTFTVASGQQAKLKALEAVAQLRPGDPRIHAELALLAAASGEWTLAALQYRELTRLEAGKADWWNSLGYAEANLNRLPAAVAALNEYRRLAPEEPNPIDSLGEVYYMNRQFKQAGLYFDEESQRYSTFQNGAAWRKAAFAYFFAGDLKTADQRFENWMKQVLVNAPPSTQSFERAMWFARTGRAKQAEELLKQEAAGTSGDRKLAAELHLAMIQFGLSGKRPEPAALSAFSAQLKDPRLRSEFAIFALLSQAAKDEAELIVKMGPVISQPQFAAVNAELLAAAKKLMAAPSTEKPKVFPLPNAADSPIDAVLLRQHLAVIP